VPLVQPRTGALRFVASHPRAPPGAASAFDAGEARRTIRAIARRNDGGVRIPRERARMTTPGVSHLLESVVARCRLMSLSRARGPEGLPTRLTDSASHPNAVSLVIMGRAEASSMANDRVVPTNWTSPRQQVQRDHPGSMSMLSFGSGSAIKRITAGVKARP